MARTVKELAASDPGAKAEEADRLAAQCKANKERLQRRVHTAVDMYKTSQALAHNAKMFAEDLAVEFNAINENMSNDICRERQALIFSVFSQDETASKASTASAPTA